MEWVKPMEVGRSLSEGKPKRPECIISLWSGFSSCPHLAFFFGVSLWFVTDAYLTLSIILFLLSWFVIGIFTSCTI